MLIRYCYRFVWSRFDHPYPLRSLNRFVVESTILSDAHRTRFEIFMAHRRQALLHAAVRVGLGGKVARQDLATSASWTGSTKTVALLPFGEKKHAVSPHCESVRHRPLSNISFFGYTTRMLLLVAAPFQRRVDAELCPFIETGIRLPYKATYLCRPYRS
jgi:hypothetical protein